MKCTSILLLLLITITLSSFPHQIHSICMDYDPTNLNNLSIVDCTPKQIDNIPNDDNFQFDSSSLFQVEFNCQINDRDLCSKVEKTFNTAGDIITYALTLNTPIIVSATFTTMDPKNLGGATPTRYISLLDEDDNVERLYPQALVKQFNLPIQTATYADSDITAQFNSLIDWYVPDVDDNPIRKNQYDLLNTVLHEIIHGLGFVSSWRDDVDSNLKVPTRGLTPFLITESNGPINPLDIPSGQFKFLAFYETIFDKFIVAKKDDKQTRLSEYADKLNQFSGINQQFASLSDFNAELQNSPQNDTAGQVLSLSTTKNSLIFMPKDGRNIPDDGIVLETKINPYRAGVSISHVDSIIYNIGDSDFLMRRVNNIGVSMNDLIIKSGNRTGSAIGPKLLNILSSIGYNLVDNSIKPKSSASTSNEKSIIIDFTFIFLCIIINQVL